MKLRLTIAFRLGGFSHSFVSFFFAAILLFGLVDAGNLGNGVVAESLPTAASLVCVFDEPGLQENPQSGALKQ